MGMASAARQKQMQPQPGQRPQLGSPKGQPAATQQPQGGFGGLANQIGNQMGGLQPLQPQPMQPQPQPYIGNTMNNEQLPVPVSSMQPPSPLGSAAAQLGSPKGQPFNPAMGGLSGMGDLQRQALQQGEMTNPYIRPNAGIYDAAGREIPGSIGGQMPTSNEYSVARQPMAQPAVQQPQMSQEQMLQRFADLTRGTPAPAPVAAAPKPFMAQPVVKESPRQAAQRRMQQMANIKRFGMR